MSQFKVLDNPQQKDWDFFLDSLVHGNLQQSFDYGEAAKLFNHHTRVVRLFAVDGESPVSLVQGTFNRRFGFGDRLLVGGVYGDGPVVANVENREQVLIGLLSDLEKHAIKNRVSEAFIYRLNVESALEKLGYDLSSVFNVYKVNLKKSVDELWKSITHNKRKNVKKAQTHKVEVTQGMSDKELASFYEMHSIAGKRAEFEPHSLSYFYSFLKTFGTKEKAKIFLSVFNGQPVAGVFVVVHGDTAYALGAGSRDEAWSVRPNDILHWKAMEWACSERLAFYHMGFVDEPPPVEGLSGWSLWRWKREWNGQLQKVYLYHKVFMPRFRKFVLTPYEKIYNLARKANF
ncbi:peptidoglycan bridge formation glycyltransferase FemA/FemB family protein [Candidatus Bathyarchaeota archaeon]|nr:peptidoglycan bridge formation glycyltransferase FemA/FemB family protein [Candidatus Bathyarchaeota archaeon]